VQEPEWARFYPDFEALCADGRFEALAPLVHGPLAQWVAEALEISPHAPAQPDAPESAGSEAQP